MEAAFLFPFLIYQKKECSAWNGFHWNGGPCAIFIRVLATIAVVWLLKIPGLLIAGGLLLLWIAYKLLVDEKDHEIEAKDSLLAAIRTILIADGIFTAAKMMTGDPLPASFVDYPSWLKWTIAAEPSQTPENAHK